MASNLRHPISLVHTWQMLGRFGLYQHAEGVEPRLSEGYCVDDNARAVQTFLKLIPHVQVSDRERLKEAIALCWKFILDAQHGDSEIYNFRTSTGVWLTHDISADMYARVLRCCAVVLAEDDDAERKQQAATLAATILDAYEQRFVSARSWAEALIAIALLKKNPINISTTKQAEAYCLNRLKELWKTHSSTEWPWFEDSLTYANALLQHGMLHASDIETEIVRQSSQFLIGTTITKDNMFIPIGNSAWYSRGNKQSLYDQQPIEAGVMFDFLLDIKEHDDTAVSLAQVAAPYLWFFGNNTKHVSMVDEKTGACFDGLQEDGPNTNCGAESLLAYLWVEARLREASTDLQEYIAHELQKLNS